LRDARDLAILVHADVLVVDLGVVFVQRVDHHLVDHAVALVVDADALRVDDLDGRLGADRADGRDAGIAAPSGASDTGVMMDSRDTGTVDRTDVGERGDADADESDR
jgi:hypothetical protein